VSKLPRRHRRSTAGFTLPEVLVALAIFVILGLAMIQLSSTVYYREALHRDTLAASALAQSQVEDLLRAGYEDPRLVDPDGGDDVAEEGGKDLERFRDPDHADPNNPLDAEGGTAGERRFTRVWNVGEDTPLAGLKTVTVLVGWRDARGQQQVVTETIQIPRLK
jgi:prepilin-type N-terminal cleavage/methylation domain-containing protein